MLLMCSASLMCSAQSEEFNDKGQIIYITGTTKVAGYSVITRTVDATSTKIVSKAPAPILQYYISKKNEFIGGELVNAKGKTTKILDMKFEAQPDRKTDVFTVFGKDFSMSFKLENGFILSDETSDIVFYVDKSGIWKVKRK